MILNKGFRTCDGVSRSQSGSLAKKTQIYHKTSKITLQVALIDQVEDPPVVTYIVNQLVGFHEMIMTKGFRT